MLLPPRVMRVVSRRYTHVSLMVLDEVTADLSFDRIFPSLILIVGCHLYDVLLLTLILFPMLADLLLLDELLLLLIDLFAIVEAFVAKLATSLYVGLT